MRLIFSRPIKSSLMAIGLAAGLSLPAVAAPLAVPSVPSAAPVTDIVPVRAEWAGNSRDSTVWRYNRHRRGDGWRHNRNWQGERWSHNDNWRRHNNWRRSHHRGYYGGSGVYFGLGAFGVAPAYEYYAPRRAYRVQRGGSAHVRWCYNRYRSYRAWDNTFQPYNGPRRQCRSPYR